MIEERGLGTKQRPHPGVEDSKGLCLRVYVLVTATMPFAKSCLAVGAACVGRVGKVDRLCTG